MCVNVSGRQRAHVDLASDIELVLQETGLKASCLKLEITESVYIGDVGSAEAALKRLQSLGVEWSIDGFGTPGVPLVETGRRRRRGWSDRGSALARMRRTVSRRERWGPPDPGSNGIVHRIVRRLPRRDAAASSLSFVNPCRCNKLMAIDDR